jgi:hypothetical protein
MAHVQFTDVQDRPLEFLDVTSLTLDEFQQLVHPSRRRSKRLWRRGASMGSRGRPAVSACTSIVLCQPLRIDCCLFWPM